ncbi:Alpha/Beta hydrolase protein [Mycena floridula]|nr:Alpha/Beta hydrolase protein [Mycena floridula]
MRSTTLALLWAGFLALAGASQKVLVDPDSTVQTLHLSALSGQHFTKLSHPRFPNHSVRVKKTDFCDPTVNVYTGYLDADAGAKHMFFYFFESRSSPDKDDILMWINGARPGPGCSSSMGLLMELGPCSIDMSKNSTNGTIWNPYGWNEVANIFFLDQPQVHFSVGVGFSYADFGETVETTEAAAKNVHAFITIFFQVFKQFSGRPLHLAGESYGGRYLPVFASEIYDQNQIDIKADRTPLNLQSVLIGNGITDISTLYEGRYAVECGTASLPVPFQSIGTCVRMKTALPRCQKAMAKGCVDTFDMINCRAAVSFCDAELSTGMWNSGRNVYDISKPCIGNDLCYEENTVIREYLDLPETRDLLGVETPFNFTPCSSIVGQGFNAHMDKWAHRTQDYVSNLLDRDIRILIYAGTTDWQCNWVANKLWVDKLEWSGQEAYASAHWRNWPGGEVKETPLLTFATIRGAGHMVPHDKPVESLQMVKKWLSSSTLTTVDAVLVD